MLSAKVYHLLYRYAGDIGDGNILEIGSAHGAGTVSLALGAKDGNSSATVVAVEKGEGGSRSEYGSKEKNIKILQENFQEFGISDRVNLVDQHLTREDGLPENVQSHVPFSLVCVDADGNLDRDFELLYNKILPGSVIVIDDYSPRRAYREKSTRYPLEGGKHYRTFCYANWLIENGFIHRYKIIGPTLFAVKSPNPPNIDKLQRIEKIQNHLQEDRERHN